jgi:hypothetical protein
MWYSPNIQNSTPNPASSKKKEWMQKKKVGARDNM